MRTKRSIKKTIDKKNKKKLMTLLVFSLLCTAGMAHGLGLYTFANEASGDLDLENEIDDEIESEDGLSGEEGPSTENPEDTTLEEEESDEDLEGESDEESTDEESSEDKTEDKTEDDTANNEENEEDIEEEDDSKVEELPTKVEAIFSFDGDNKNKLILTEEYQEYGLEWEYTIDSEEWNTTKNTSINFTTEEVAEINASDNIKLCVAGQDRNSDNIFVIDIKEGEEPEGLYANDRENLLFGYDSNMMEWYHLNSDTWVDTDITEDMLEKDFRLSIRNGARGTTLASEAIVLNFTDETYEEEREYVKLEYQSINDYIDMIDTDENNHSIGNLLDGNGLTYWYYENTQNEEENYVVIELEMPIFLSALEYVPRQDNNALGMITELEVLVSIDGNEWTQITTAKDWEIDHNNKVIEIPEDMRQTSKYVKIISKESYGKDREDGEEEVTEISAAMFNLFEDTTLAANEKPQAILSYTTTDWTNENVTVSIEGVLEPITVLNNGGSKEYTFIENDVFIFEIENLRGVKNYVVASVTNIDKVIPEAKVVYTRLGITVTASLTDASENILVYGPSSYTFVKNGSYTFYFVDKAGNIGTAEAVVDSIYSTTDTPSDPVIPEVDYGTTPDSNSGNSSGGTTTTPNLNIPSVNLLPTILGSSSSSTNTSDTSDSVLEDLLADVELYEENEDLETPLGTLLWSAVQGDNSELNGAESEEMETVGIYKAEEVDLLLLMVQTATILSIGFIAHVYYKTRKNNKASSQDGSETNTLS